MRNSRILAAIAMAAILLPLASAQTSVTGGGGTFTNPILGAYGDIYLVAGRAVDALGQPVVNGELTVDLEMKGINAKPVRAITDCFGVYITYFDIKSVSPAGKVVVTLKGQDGVPGVRGEDPLDPFFRRSDINLSYEGQSSARCGDQTNVWPNRVSITGRILNRTDSYEANGSSLDARPEGGRVRLRYLPPDSPSQCPPSQFPGACDPIPIDERGDFKYSWVFGGPVDAEGVIQVIYGADNATWNFTINPTFRYALALVETTGRGPPPTPAPTPTLPLLGVLAAVAFAAAGRSLLARNRAR